MLDSDGGTKADALAQKLRSVLGESAQITRPIKMGEIRLMGFDLTVSDLDIKDAIASSGKCSVEEGGPP